MGTIECGKEQFEYRVHHLVNCAENCAENEYDVPSTEELEKAMADLMGEIKWTASLN